MLISLAMWNTNVRLERKFLVDKRDPFRLPTKNSYRTVLLRVTPSLLPLNFIVSIPTFAAYALRCESEATGKALLTLL